MSDCANVEMRELLPELAAGTLDAATRARVDEHLVDCADCASELETLRLVRAAFASAPAVDVRRVVAALPAPVVAAQGSRESQPVKRWMDWRVAAALTTITVGGLSLAVSQRMRQGTEMPPRDSVAVSTPPVAPPKSAAANSPRVVGAAPRDTHPSPTTNRRPSLAKAQLSFGGGTDDLDDASLRELLGALDEIDRAPLAPSAEPDRTPVLPVIKEGAR
jgi:anti-sigma factor RsiW